MRKHPTSDDDEHLRDLLDGHTTELQRRDNVAGDVQIVPVGQRFRRTSAGRIVDVVARCVVTQDDLVGPAQGAQSCDGGDAIVEPEESVDAEPVHADVCTRVGDREQVVEVGGIAAVADHDAGRVHAFPGEDLELVEPAAGGRAGVGGGGGAAGA